MSARPATLDSVLDLRALVVQGVGGVQVALRDHVEEVVCDLACGADPARVAGGLDGLDVERCPSARVFRTETARPGVSTRSTSRKWTQ